MLTKQACCASIIFSGWPSPNSPLVSIASQNCANPPLRTKSATHCSQSMPCWDRINKRRYGRYGQLLQYQVYPAWQCQANEKYYCLTSMPPFHVPPFTLNSGDAGSPDATRTLYVVTVTITVTVLDTYQVYSYSYRYSYSSRHNYSYSFRYSYSSRHIYSYSCRYSYRYSFRCVYRYSCRYIRSIQGK